MTQKKKAAIGQRNVAAEEMDQQGSRPAMNMFAESIAPDLGSIFAECLTEYLLTIRAVNEVE